MVAQGFTVDLDKPLVFQVTDILFHFLCNLAISKGAPFVSAFRRLGILARLIRTGFISQLWAKNLDFLKMMFWRCHSFSFFAPRTLVLCHCSRVNNMFILLQTVSDKE